MRKKVCTWNAIRRIYLARHSITLIYSHNNNNNKKFSNWCYYMKWIFLELVCNWNSVLDLFWCYSADFEIFWLCLVYFYRFILGCFDFFSPLPSFFGIFRLFRRFFSSKGGLLDNLAIFTRFRPSWTLFILLRFLIWHFSSLLIFSRSSLLSTLFNYLI